ncbi:hypothetical protein [Acidianus sp. RZ1]|uniref:hypothetical protein n=1 Tax=Acidianus sp. RZ1 TaxID=1540082 RepID=UPI001492A6B8|nr:hypothetical protein [Acidianus sp. RZ1]NON62743.1 hypothetical protein [Acidianus sp. RZ1]
MKSVLIAIGIALLSLSLISINAHITFTRTLTQKPFTISIPSTAVGVITISSNSSNITVYITISHNGRISIEKLPYSTDLSPGKWVIEGYKQIQSVIVKKIINETESLKCGNITTQKVINQSVKEISGTVTSPVYVKITILKVNPLAHTLEVKLIGLLMIFSGIILWILEKIK